MCKCMRVRPQSQATVRRWQLKNAGDVLPFTHARLCLRVCLAQRDLASVSTPVCACIFVSMRRSLRIIKLAYLLSSLDTRNQPRAVHGEWSGHVL